MQVLVRRFTEVDSVRWQGLRACGMELLGVQVMNRSIFVKIVAVVVLCVFSAGTWITSGKLNVTWLQYFSASVFLATALLAIWDLFLWRTRPAQLLPGVPRCIRGTWKGTVASLWDDPQTGEKPSQIEGYLVVRQTFKGVSVNLMTKESTSSSSLAQVVDADGTAALSYLYLNQPRTVVRERSPIHHGSAILEVAGKPVRRLSGRYWTDRDSRGELKFEQRCRRIADDFAEAASYFPALESQALTLDKNVLTSKSIPSVDYQEEGHS